MRRTSGPTHVLGAGIAIIASIALIAGCSPSAETGSPSEAPAGSFDLTLGIDGGTGTALYVVAWKNGYFAEEGINVVASRQFLSGNEALQAQLAGEVDLSSVTDLPVISARAKAEEQGMGAVEIIGAMAVGPQVHALTVSESIESPEDLERDDVKVGVTLGSGGEYSMHAFVKNHDLDADQIEVVNVGTDDMVAAFTRGDIQAFFSWAPITQTAVQTVAGAYIFEYGDEYDWTSRNYIVASERLSQDEEASEAVLRALDTAAQWTEENRDEAIQILSDTLSVPVDALELPFSLFKYEVSFTDDHVSTLTNVATWAVETEKIPGVPTWSEFVNLAPMTAAVPEAMTADLGGLE
ncbi:MULTISPECIES: ABC transporter substrate-binding protein [unclassified Microbacterium]|uniref:ABC transporter substrate-binding protein n=1 Tax=unclassified Microbacterium TaxID=2609290 RepID=UPI000C2C862C|nr:MULTISPECIES: ABC transporter substrate-binding protein [unclassified Microbacterium]